MNIGTIGYWILESFEGIKKNSKTFLIGLGTMLIVLSLIGGLYIVYENAISFMGDVQEDESKVNLYVEGLTTDEIDTILVDLKKINGVSNVEYISSEQAFDIARDEMHIDVEGYYKDESFFPASFVLTVDEVQNGNMAPLKNAVYSISKLAGAITDDNGFEEASRVIKIAISVRIISITLLILCIVMGCFLMMNSIKLALYARRKEISIMKYVGATDTFTRAPFIIEGIIIALLAAGITLLLTNVLYDGLINIVGTGELSSMFNFLVPTNEVLSSVSILLLIVSIGIGTIGSSMSISKYLDV